MLDVYLCVCVYVLPFLTCVSSSNHHCAKGYIMCYYCIAIMVTQIDLLFEGVLMSVSPLTLSPYLVPVYITLAFYVRLGSWHARGVVCAIVAQYCHTNSLLHYHEVQPLQCNLTVQIFLSLPVEHFTSPPRLLLH